jgi:Holliday junction resolvase RusA-like endonuclease
MAATSEPDGHRQPGDRAGAAAAEQTQVIAFVLPVAPTVNSAWYNRRGGRGFGRIRSERYHKWLRQADRWYLIQKLGKLPKLSPPFRCYMEFPRLKGDIDNRAKLLLDYMVSREITPDDRHCCELLLKRGGQTDGMVWIQLFPASASG